MSRDRAVEVYAEKQDGSWSCGTGCALGGELIVTAAHVLRVEEGQISANVVVRQIGGRECAVEILFVDDDSIRDMAILRVYGENWKPVRPFVRFGRLATMSARKSQALGFPDFQTSRAKRDTELATGFVNAGTTIKAKLIAFAVSDPPKRVVESRSPWAGMSGAGVFCDGLLVGIVTRDPGALDSHRLVVSPISEALRQVDFRRAVEHSLMRRVELEAVEFSRIQASIRRIESPGDLLRSENCVVPFVDRPEIGEIISFCMDDDREEAALLVQAPGGQGKTRLAAEVAKRLEALGWETVYLDPDALSRDLESLASSLRPLLIVVDYVELRDRQFRDLYRAVDGSDGFVRMLLLGRNVQHWRRYMGSRYYELMPLLDCPVVELPPLGKGNVAREKMWRTAVSAFCVELRRLDGYSDADWDAIRGELDRPDLKNDRFDRVLEIQVHALATLLAAERGFAAVEHLDVLIEHEQRYWTRVATLNRVDLHPVTLRGVVAASTIWSARTRQDAVAVLSATPGTRDIGDDRRIAVAESVSQLYASSVLDRFWWRVQPDRLAEHIIGTVLDVTENPDLLNDALSRATPQQVTNAITALSQAAVHYPHLDLTITRLLAASPVATIGSVLDIQDRVRRSDVLSRELLNSPFFVATNADLPRIFGVLLVGLILVSAVLYSSFPAIQSTINFIYIAMFSVLIGGFAIAFIIWEVRQRRLDREAWLEGGLPGD